MKKTVGTCSLCGGAVLVPMVWHGIHPPTPSCAKCGAVPKEAHGPIIAMDPDSRRWGDEFRAGTRSPSE